MTTANMEKLKSLVHYICNKCDDASKLGATKLNKIMYYSDMLAYMQWNSPITNECYIKRQFGPVPSHILSVVDTLVADGKIEIKESSFHGFKKKDYLSRAQPDISEFSAEEISLIDEVIDEITENHTATSISDASHAEVWEMAGIGEELPYYSVFTLGLGEIDENDMTWAKDVLQAA